MNGYPQTITAPRTSASLRTLALFAVIAAFLLVAGVALALGALPGPRERRHLAGAPLSGVPSGSPGKP